MIDIDSILRLDAIALDNKQEKNEQVVRLATSAWKDKQGIHLKRSLLFQRRKSSGFQILEDDVDMVGASETLARIENLSKCEDGLYKVITCNERKDWETGMVDDYDFRLVPYKEKQNPTK